jgi:hypothetical protein
MGTCSLTTDSVIALEEIGINNLNSNSMDDE